MIKDFYLKDNLEITVIGDAMLDKYIIGSSDRISPEAPVPVVKVNNEIYKPGGAANVAVNLSKLGCKVNLISLIGKDQNSKLLKQLLKKYKIKTSCVLGHSDIAPNRKKDPGEKFPWKKLAKDNLCLWHSLNEKNIKKLRKKKLTLNDKNTFFKNLFKIGYSRFDKKSLIIAFQRKFRQELINGKIDKECFLISKNLIKL